MSQQTITFAKWKEHLATLIRMYRAVHGLGVRQFAKKYGFSPATVSRIERGHGCDVATILAIHELTGLSIESLMNVQKKR